MPRLLELEISGPRNEALFFMPIGERVRGAYRWSRACDVNAAAKAEEWTDEIPGQNIVIDLDARQGEIHERLRDEEHRALKDRFERKKLGIPYHRPFRVTSDEDLATALFWIGNAIKCGTGRLTARSVQELPKLPAKPRVRFLHRDDTDDEAAKSPLVAELKRQAVKQEERMEKLEARLEQQAQQNADTNKALMTFLERMSQDRNDRPNTGGNNPGQQRK